MSLKNALETAREILEQHQSIEETYSEAEEMKKKKGTKAGGEDKDVSVDAEGHGEKSADGVTPKAIEPLEGGQLGKADSGKEVVGDLKDKEEEEYGEGEEAEDEYEASECGQGNRVTCNSSSTYYPQIYIQGAKRT